MHPPILFGDHVIGRGEELFREICKAGGEGLIAKAANAPYRGERSRNWLKVKCIQRQEFVIIGWSESDKRRGFRSLLLGTRDGRKLTYAGKVGTGFNGDVIEELMERMEPLETDKAAVEVPRAERKGAHWIKPKLVAEIAFAEFTGDGILRHPSFVALREDKPAKEVVREVPQHLKTPAKEDRSQDTPRAIGIEISNPDRVIYPEGRRHQGRPRQLLCGGRQVDHADGRRSADDPDPLPAGDAARNASSRSTTAARSAST